MFEGAQTRFPRLLPILTPTEVADRILLAIQRNEFIVLYPKLLYVFKIVKPILPINALYRMFQLKKTRLFCQCQSLSNFWNLQEDFIGQYQIACF